MGWGGVGAQTNRLCRSCVNRIEMSMKRVRVFVGVLMVLGLALAACGGAAPRGTVSGTARVQAGGVEVATVPGHGEVTIRHGGRVEQVRRQLLATSSPSQCRPAHIRSACDAHSQRRLSVWPMASSPFTFVSSRTGLRTSIFNASSIPEWADRLCPVRHDWGRRYSLDHAEHADMVES